jgi:F0F1-type ATP synthase gamma subunit
MSYRCCCDAHQGAITSELLDVVGGFEAMSGLES